MQIRGVGAHWRGRSAIAAVCAGLAALTIGACGGSGSSSSGTGTGTPSATTLLKQTFTGAHPVNSGVLHFSLTLTPHNSSLISGPVVLSASGPFQSEGAGKLPDADITLAIQAEGEQAQMRLISTGGKAWVELAGTTYALPTGSLKKVESGLGAGNGKSGLSANAEFKKLGIRPLNWVAKGASVAGHAQLGGVQTTHVHAAVDTKAMLRDLSKLLGESEQLGIKGSTKDVPSNIPAATQRKIVHALGKPSFDVWTGSSDKTVRKLTVSATIPVTGSASKSLEGLTSAGVSLSFAVSDLNQHQQVQAPTGAQPYSALRKQLSSLVTSLTQGLSNGTLTGGTGTSTSTSALGAADQKYAKCITAAKGDVTKMQRCTSLLGNGG